ncbi:MAG: hypothetical protein ACYCYO_05505 [Bacilli bacterium]
MGNHQVCLERFRNSIISRQELERTLQLDVYKYRTDDPVEVCNVHLINVLRQHQQRILSKERLIEWVNVIWFSGAFEYSDEHHDSLASVMNELEELDEGDIELTNNEIERYIFVLSTNSEV